MEDINEQLFGQPFKEFTEHLNIPDNERIIFSAKFGMGKTTFLKWYFKQGNVKEKYNCIHLFPVNYSIAGNEDIFRYMKYDTIVELLKQGYEVKEEDVHLTEVFKQFFKKNYEKITASIIYMIPHLGKEVIDRYDRIKPLIDTFFEMQAKMQLDAKEGDRLIDYLGNLENKEGNIFEDDIISKLIEGILYRARAVDSETPKQNVLIVDDLDRIDPDHVFRLLNIFAAHFDRPNPTMNKNKFGFDKVIFVCDIKNIREIFRHKYGLSVDFNGYINKFFSNTIFNFNHVDYYATFVTNALLKVPFYYGDKKDYTIDDLNNDAKDVIRTFLKIYTLNQFFDLRNIVKWANRRLQYKSQFTIGSIPTSFFAYNAVPAIKFLNDILGSTGALYNSISELKNRQLFSDRRPENIRDFICGELILLLNYNHDLYNTPEIKYTLNGRALNFIFKSSMRNFILKEIRGSVGSPEVFLNTTDEDFIELFHRSVRLLDENHLL